MANATKMIAALLLLLTAVVPQTAASNSFSMMLPRYSTECFFESLNANDRLDVSFEVAVGAAAESEYEIDFVLSNPDGSVLHTVRRHLDAQFGFNAVTQGIYKMCFVNNWTGTDKFIMFSITGPEEHKKITEVQTKDAKPDEDHEEISRTLQVLNDNLRFMRDEQGYLIRRQQRHAQTADSTNSRVFWWSLAQTVLLIGVCAFQVLYLRRFFETRRVI